MKKKALRDGAVDMEKAQQYREQAIDIVSVVLPLVEQILIQHWSAALEEIHVAIQRKNLCPEECILTAHHTGDGWHLAVADRKGHEIALVAWPKSWPISMTKSAIQDAGFKVVP